MSGPPAPLPPFPFPVSRPSTLSGKKRKRRGKDRKRKKATVVKSCLSIQNLKKRGAEGGEIFWPFVGIPNSCVFPVRSEPWENYCGTSCWSSFSFWANAQRQRGIFLRCDDGVFNLNFWLSLTIYWNGLEMDQTRPDQTRSSGVCCFVVVAVVVVVIVIIAIRQV
jgi:hypothetical protein